MSTERNLDLLGVVWIGLAGGLRLVRKAPRQTPPIGERRVESRCCRAGPPPDTYYVRTGTFQLGVNVITTLSDPDAGCAIATAAKAKAACM